MRKIKVVHFVSGLVSGGVEEMLCNYCKFMDSSRYEFVVIYQHEPIETCKDKIEGAGCKTIRITARNENFIKNISDSIKIIKKEKPDIVHAHMNLMNFCALYAAKRADISIRISHSHIAEKNKNFLFKIMALICKFLCKYYATDLFTCGEEAGEYLYGKKLMSTGEVKLIENAIDLNYYKIDKERRQNVRDALGVSDKFVIGHVGRFSYQKNHERLLSIFAEVLKKNNNATLLLVGTGENLENIKQLVQRMGIRDKVIFYGTTNNMIEVYSAMDVFVLPSRFEGFPVVSIEVQAADLPAVFSDTIAPTCKLTDAIVFESLNKSDEQWANTIIKTFRCKKENCLDALLMKYEIREKVKQLDKYYKELLFRNNITI